MLSHLSITRSYFTLFLIQGEILCPKTPSWHNIPCGKLSYVECADTFEEDRKLE